MGDKTREEYLRERTQIMAEIAGLKPAEDRTLSLDRAADVLGKFYRAWAQGGATQKRKMARRIFEEI